MDSFQRCVRHVQRQKYLGSIQWVIVDDGWTHVEKPMLRELDEVTLIQLTARPREITLVRNLLAALDAVKFDLILIVEDDDWYSDQYVHGMSEILRDHDMAGCSESRYYHVPSRRYRILKHPGRSSLCHTGFRRSQLPRLREICEKARNPFVDVPFWEETMRVPGCLRRDPLCIGIKGMPGRDGIGVGHRPQNGDGWIADNAGTLQGSVLRSWIGEDAEELLSAH